MTVDKTGKKEKKMEKQKKKLVRTGNIGTRGRTFQGMVVKRFEKRVVIELGRTVRILKFERFAKKKTRIHARIPKGMTVHVGDIVKVRECRPLSKIIHFMVVEVVKGQDDENKEEKK